MSREPQTVNFPRNIPRIPPLLIRLPLKIPTDPSFDVEPLPHGRSVPPLSPEEVVQLVERRTPDHLHQRIHREFLQHRLRRGHAAENGLRQAVRRTLRRPLLGEGATGRRDRRRLSTLPRSFLTVPVEAVWRDWLLDEASRRGQATALATAAHSVGEEPAASAYSYVDAAASLLPTTSVVLTSVPGDRGLQL